MGFGSFDSVCEQSALPLCFILGPPAEFTSVHTPVLLPACSARSIELANTIIFQAATDFAHIAALFMTAIMIFHVRSKFTAVGRREILTFFYIYILLSVVSLVLDAGVIQATTQTAYPWFVAVQNGLASALCTSLLINGFVGFQLYEDGTTLSVWLLRLGSLIMFLISFAVSLLTFKGWAGLSPTNTTGLFVVLYIINAVFLAVYFVMQVILVLNTLQDRWPLGDLAFGAFFFIIGQVILYAFGKKICEGVSHYLDGLFFATVCNLLGVMMVYKVSDYCSKNKTPLPSVSAILIDSVLRSTGTVSPRKTSNSASAPNKAIGMSRRPSSTQPTTSMPASTVAVATTACTMQAARLWTMCRRPRHQIRTHLSNLSTKVPQATNTLRAAIVCPATAT